MKKSISVFLALVLALVLCVPTYAAEPSYTLTALANNSANPSVKTGDTITVTLKLTEDGSSDFTLYSMQDYVCFDPDYLQYVDDSISVLTAGGSNVLTATAQSFHTASGGKIDQVFINRASSDGQAVSGDALLTFRLKALKTGSTAITHNTMEVFQYSARPYPVTGQPATVTIGQPETYTASFEGGTGATGSTASVSALEGTQITLPANGFSRTGYDFAGWSLAGTTYQGGDSYTLSASVTFTALWNAKQVSITLKDGFGSGSSTLSAQYGGSVTLPVSPFTREGYTFSGWSDGSKTYQPGESYTAGLTNTLTAQWTQVQQPTTNTTTPTTGSTGSTGSGGSSGGGGGGGSSTSTAKPTETISGSVTSTTTTTTDKVTGTVTETTTKTDGTVSTKETKTDGTVTETTTKTDGSSSVVETKVDGTVTEKNTTSEGVVGTVVTNAAGTVTQASAEIPAAAAKSEGPVTVPVTVAATKSTETASVVNIKVEDNSSTKVEIPVTDVKPGVVAVLVKPDGTEEIIKTSSISDTGVLLTVDGSAEIKLVDNSKEYNDVHEEQWYNDSVDYVSAREIMSGTGDGSFSPNVEMSRAMLTQVLYSLEGKPEAGKNQFQDVSNDAWYGNAVSWAVENSIISGVGDGQFAPNASLTREQMAVILYGYAKNKGLDTTVTSDLSDFKDANSASDWSRTALEWALSAGMISGKGDGILDPTGTSTRAEIATILTGFCKFMAR